MILDEIAQYNPITIQCHDNPDADAIGSAYALSEYFWSLGKNVRIIYSGRSRIQKPNFRMLIEEYNIPIQYAEQTEVPLEGILVMVDCQYGAGNVTKFYADAYAEIDHHRQDGGLLSLSDIRPQLGSCATLIYSLFREIGFDISKRRDIGTALYYGLYTDTNQFSEITSPSDMDLREGVPFDPKFVTRLRNSNLSLKELEIAGIALIRYIYNREYRYAIIQSQPCDSNILGLISDFVLQVHEIDCCVVYNTQEDGFKFSVRSCIKEVKANELASFLAQGMGSGGGHEEKAGGFITYHEYRHRRGEEPSETYFSSALCRYFDKYDILDATGSEVIPEDMKPGVRKKINIGCVLLDSLFPKDTPVVLRTALGDRSYTIRENEVLVMLDDDTIFRIDSAQLSRYFDPLFMPYDIEADYRPILKNRNTGESVDLLMHVNACVAKEEEKVFIKRLDKALKLFTSSNPDSYTRGEIGDYLVMCADKPEELSIVTHADFEKRYRFVSEE